VTHRLTIGGDPGQSGAIALLDDGEFAGFIDMPVMARKAGGHMVNAYELCDALRAHVARFPGAFLSAAIEDVHAMPDQGVSGAFRFGQSEGILRCALAALHIGVVEVSPVRWKKVFGLTGKPKDVARTLAIQRHPKAADELKRKKDIGRADALLIATWAHMTEAVGQQLGAAA
jgi:crossover junction endodeoxyribonuclease RuvC